MSDKGTEPAHLSNLQAEIARKVLTFVKEGRWAIGEHVSEQRLSEELGTSRSPVRHVLQYLTNLGLFTKIPNVGFRLTGALLQNSCREGFTLRIHAVRRGA